MTHVGISAIPKSRGVLVRVRAHSGSIWSRLHRWTCLWMAVCETTLAPPKPILRNDLQPLYHWGSDGVVPTDHALTFMWGWGIDTVGIVDVTWWPGNQHKLGCGTQKTCFSGQRAQQFFRDFFLYMKCSE